MASETVYRNERILKGVVYVEELVILCENEVARAQTRIANVLGCDVLYTRGNEADLAMVVSDLYKRGLLNLYTFLDCLGRSQAKTGPEIDNFRPKCEHTFENFAGLERCTNCGQFKNEVEE